MTTKPVGKTDVIFQSVKLYLEGVQIPFFSIVINQGVGVLPTASISVHPQAGLMDIARFYQPKVHIFFTEITDKSTTDSEKLDRLLFAGVIRSVSYQKSRSGSGNVSIDFQCVHKNSLINDCLIDYTNWVDSPTGANDAVLTANRANSDSSINEALKGISEVTDGTNAVSEDNPNGEPSVVPVLLKDFHNRYLGMPGVLVNFWNQLNQAAYNPNGVKPDAFTKLYKPLIELGLLFFQRFGGHSFLETQIQNDKQDPCSENPKVKGNILIPPCNHLFLKSAAQAELTIKLLGNYLQNSGEVTNIFDLFNTFYQGMDYELLTLASPAEVALDPQASDSTKTYALETIAKPVIPFYFAPTCNVLLPGMYTDLNVSYEEASVPTRVDFRNIEPLTENSNMPMHYRAPNSVRTAVALARKKLTPDTVPNLSASLTSSYGAVGQFEQGRGIIVEYASIPRWLSYLSQTAYGNDRKVTDLAPDENTDKVAFDALGQLATGWTKRYGDFNKLMNPWSVDGGLSPHQRILVSAADYYHMKSFARSKNGSVRCNFNPYIVPGYPMDILEKSPILPSFHATCMTVTHNITAQSVDTTVGFTAATTYSELSNYYLPFMTPYLQVALGLAEDPTILGDAPNALEYAHNFYYTTLGVTAADPKIMYDFSNNTLKPVAKNDGRGVWTNSGASANSKLDANGGELNPNLSFEGNLSLVYRPIENKADFKERFGLKYIDLVQNNYTSTVIRVAQQDLKPSSALFEVGESQFLTYDTYFGNSEVPWPTSQST